MKKKKAHKKSKADSGNFDAPQSKPSPLKQFFSSPWFLPALLIVLSAIPRFFIFSNLSERLPYADWSPNYRTYLWALDHHFWDYIFRFAFKAPFYVFIQKFLLILFGTGEVLYNNLIFLWTVISFDMAGLWFSWDLLRRLKVRPWISFPILLLGSFYLIPLELWQEGFHYDQYSFCLTAAFFHALILLREKISTKRIVYLSLMGGITASFSPVLPFAGLVGLGFALLLIEVPEEHKKTKISPWLFRGKILIFCSLGFFLVLTALKIKNVKFGIGPVTSNAGGWNIMHVVHHSLGKESPRVNRLVLESNVPDWYKWCYQNADPTPFSGPNSRHLLYLAQSRGMCAPARPSYVIEDWETWPYDYSTLLNYLETEGFEDVADVVRKDIDDMTHRPYLFSGPGPEIMPRFIGVFGNESVKIAKEAVKKYPKEMWYGVETRHGLFRDRGPFSTLGLVGQLQRRNATYIPFIRLSKFFGGAYNLLKTLFFWGIPIYIVAFFLRKKINLGLPFFGNFFLFALPGAVLVTMYCALTYTENDRYFILALPFILYALSVVLNGLLDLVKNLSTRLK